MSTIIAFNVPRAELTSGPEHQREGATHQFMLLQPRSRLDLDTTARIICLIEEAIEAAALLEARARRGHTDERT